jgi:acetyltransferase-like isoleucine patch superfamily enzyme
MMEPILEYEGVSYSPKIEIGNDVSIGSHVYMATIGRLAIGDGSVLSENVYLNDTSHGFDPEKGHIMRQNLVHGGNITIGGSCFLGLRSAIMPGVTLGDHCVVGTGAVVTKSFPAYSMLAGVPAVLVKRYSLEEKQWVRVKSC